MDDMENHVKAIKEMSDQFIVHTVQLSTSLRPSKTIRMVLLIDQHCHGILDWSSYPSQDWKERLSRKYAEPIKMKQHQA